jgi:hypothetical protein
LLRIRREATIAPGDRTASAAASTVGDEELRPLVTPRRRRQPAWAAPVAAAAAVTLVIGLAVSVLNGLFGTQRPAVPTHLPAAPRRFNPLIQNVSFGWLPAGQSLYAGGFLRTEVHLATACSPSTMAARRSERTTIKRRAMPRSG